MKTPKSGPKMAIAAKAKDSTRINPIKVSHDFGSELLFSVLIL